MRITICNSTNMIGKGHKMEKATKGKLKENEIRPAVVNLFFMRRCLNGRNGLPGKVAEIVTLNLFKVV